MENKEENLLLSAEPEKGEYAPVLRVLTAVCYMGILAGVVAFMAALLSVVSNGEGMDKLAVSVIATLLFIAVVVVMSVIDKKKEREYENEQISLLENAERFDGTVTACEKHIKTIIYANSKYEEVTWRFVVTYKNEKGDTVTVKSGRYLNDISEILSSNSVTVLKVGDDEYRFEGFKTAKENCIKLDVTEIEDE